MHNNIWAIMSEHNLGSWGGIYQVCGVNAQPIYTITIYNNTQIYIIIFSYNIQYFVVVEEKGKQE